MKYKAISAVMAMILVTAVIGSASASSTPSIYDKYPQKTNKSFTDDYTNHKKSLGIKSPFVCGLKLCASSSIPPHKLANGVFPLRAP